MGALLTALKAASLHNSKFEYSNSIFPCNFFILLFTPIEKNSSRGVDHKDRGRRPISVFKTEATVFVCCFYEAVATMPSSEFHRSFPIGKTIFVLAFRMRSLVPIRGDQSKVLYRNIIQLQGSKNCLLSLCKHFFVSSTRHADKTQAEMSLTNIISTSSRRLSNKAAVIMRIYETEGNVMSRYLCSIK